MFTLVSQGGIFGIIIFVLGIIALVYVGLSIAYMVKYDSEKLDKTENSINNILRIGVFCAALGFWATIQGGYLALVEIVKAADISMQIVYNGLICALSTTVLGFEIFLMCAVVWFILKNIYRRMAGNSTAIIK